MTPEAFRPPDPEMARDAFIAAARAAHEAAVTQLRATHAEAPRRAMRRFCRAHDRLIEAAWAHIRAHWRREHDSPPPPKIALVALGGYGRRELFLNSDIDLMIVTERRSADDERCLKTLIQLLIDFRMDLGHAVRSVAECRERFGVDVESTTAMLESRFVAGRRTLFKRYFETIRKGLTGRWRKWLIRSIHAQWRARRDKFDSTVYLLEPNLKESAGGLRDVHSIQWLLFALTGSSGLEQLAPAEGSIGARAGFDAGRVRRYLKAVEHLRRVRNELHFVASGKDDRLLFEYQPRVAEAMGFRAEAHHSAAEIFMADYYRHARTVARFSERALRELTRLDRSLVRELLGGLRCRRVDEHLILRGRRLDLALGHETWFHDDPRRIMELFARAARWGWRLSEPLLDRVADAVEPLGVGFRLDPHNHRCLLDILKRPRHVAATLTDMHECGVLGMLIPEFEHLRHMVRLDHYHHYTVDEHTLRALGVAERLRAEARPDSDEATAQAAARVRRWDLLNLALLLHDVGKGAGRGHALRGGQMAERACERLGLPPDDIAVVRFLVLSHLRMTHASQRRDLGDPEVIGRLAREIGSLERLDLLYLHSICDLTAVNPDAWDAWKADLMARCHTRVQCVLDESATAAVEAPPTCSDEALRRAILDTLAQEGQGDTDGDDTLNESVAEFVGHLTERYRATAPPDLMARHFLLRRRLDERHVVQWHLTPPRPNGYSRFDVCAADVPGLFHNLCGALAAKGIGIHSAQVFSTHDGCALDCFEVSDPNGGPLPEGLRLGRLLQDLNQVLLGEKTLDALMRKHRGRRARPVATESPLAPCVEFDNDASRKYTVVEVRAIDRPGLLFRIAQALDRCQINIHRALIATEAYGVADVFYVTDLDYNKIYETHRLNRVEQTILDALATANAE